VLSAAELADLRTVAASTMTDTCQVLRPASGGSDGAGGELEPTWTPVATVPCAVAPHDVQASEGAVGAAALVGSADWRVTLPADTDVRLTDRLAQTAPAGAARTFEIQAVRGPRTREIQRVVLCSLLT
jgi:hypothetical protein